MLLMVSISFQKQANRDLAAVLSQIYSPGPDPALISRIAQYGPVCCVVWEGGAVRLPPIPIGDNFRKCYEEIVNFFYFFFAKRPDNQIKKTNFNAVTQ